MQSSLTGFICIRRDDMKHTTWQLQDAKSKFSQLVESAMADEPQIVTKHGHNAVVVLSYKEYEAMTKPKNSLVNFSEIHLWQMLN
jgi:prevent-host-death family protein